jgi:hypothetical protein
MLVCDIVEHQGIREKSGQFPGGEYCPSWTKSKAAVRGQGDLTWDKGLFGDRAALVLCAGKSELVGDQSKLPKSGCFFVEAALHKQPLMISQIRLQQFLVSLYV